MEINFLPIQKTLEKINNSKRIEKLEFEIKNQNFFTQSLLIFIFEEKKEEGFSINFESGLSYIKSSIYDFEDNIEKFLNNFSFDLKEINILSFIIGELYDNVKEHSHSPEIFLFLEKTEKQINLSVIDGGITIFNRYKETGIEVKDYKSAIEKALNGVSSRSIEERGYGLLTIQKIIKNLCGELVLISGEAIGIINKERKIEDLKFYFPGTAVLINLVKIDKNLEELI